MCGHCTTTAAERTTFRGLLAGMRLTRYADLDVPEFTPLSASGFSTKVRDHLLKDVPKLPATYRPVTCGYCQKPKDARSMELDHIIPVATYVRYKLWQAAQADPMIDSDELKQLADHFYKFAENLVFACRKCNKAKLDQHDAMMLRNGGTRTAINTLIHHAGLLGPAGGLRLLALGRTQADLAAIMVASPLGQWLRGEISLAIRGGRARMPVTKFSVSHRYDPMGPSPKSAAPSFKTPAAPPTMTLEAHGARVPGTIFTNLNITPPMLKMIEDAVFAKLVGSRANIKLAMGAAWTALLGAQTSAVAVTKNLRVCLYCLGLFHKQAFQIEHVAAVHRSALKSSTVRQYNDKLLPICGSCNGSRQDEPLSDALLTDLVAARQRAGLPGVEGICLDWAADAAARVRVLIRS